MTYLCNPRFDLPEKWKCKRVIFYAQGLKVYGEMPYLLKRKLKAEFFSNHFAFGGAFRGASMMPPSAEFNYTVIPYRQKPEYIASLLDWLFADAGFEWAIAAPEDFKRNIRCSTAFSDGPPQTWVPANNNKGWKEGFEKAMNGLPSITIQQLLKGQNDVG
jgi:hypothetical protein